MGKMVRIYKSNSITVTLIWDLEIIFQKLYGFLTTKLFPDFSGFDNFPKI